jgi:sugar phosphate isomerase/epimerase
MFSALNAGAIRVQANTLQEAIDAARRGGFAGVEFRVAEVADLIDQRGADHVRGLFAAAGVRPAAWGLGLDWQGEAAWRESLAALPRLAAAAAAIGCPRTFMVVRPASDERPFEENWRFHVERLTPIAAILAEHGCSLGFEFIGPKTLRDEQRYPFVHTLDSAIELGAAIGPNVGLLLDCYHWYTAHDTLASIQALRPEQIVHVHINDAPAGIPVDEQLDLVRALPGETGVIDIASFLQAVQALGYDGPVTAEPFKKELDDLPSDDARLATIKASIDKVFALAGIN